MKIKNLNDQVRVFGVVMCNYPNCSEESKLNLTHNILMSKQEESKKEEEKVSPPTK